MSIFDDFELEGELEQKNVETSKLFFELANGKKRYFMSRSDYEYKKLKLDSEKSINELMELIKGDCYIDEQIQSDSGNYVILRKWAKKSGKMVDSIDNGFYEIGYSNDMGYFLTETEPSCGDNFIDLGGDFKEIEDTVEKFYKKEDIYIENGMKHKMGVLLWGKPGNGKTMLIRELIKDYKDDAVIIFVDGEFPLGLIKSLKNFPDQHFVFIFEEMTQNIRRESELAAILLFLDGENSLNKQLVFATTNYPEDLPANLASRPGRFDKLFQIKDPDEETRRKYLESKLDKIPEGVLKLTEGHSIAYLKEMIISSKINDTTLEEEIKNNKQRMKLVKNAFKKSEGKLGL